MNSNALCDKYAEGYGLNFYATNLFILLHIQDKPILNFAHGAIFQKNVFVWFLYWKPT
eukprot:m.389943 g.389943  ORF g.389943 m.389943 type:complete len:58 (-) comp21055_c4_seq9:954-1127(-)